MWCWHWMCRLSFETYLQCKWPDMKSRPKKSHCSPQTGPWASQVASSVVKNHPPNAGDAGSILGSWRSPGEGNGNPLQYSCLRNPMDRGAWYATVRRVPKSLTWLSGYAKQVERGKKKKINYFLTFYIYPVSGKLFIMCITNNNKKKKWANLKHF